MDESRSSDLDAKQRHRAEKGKCTYFIKRKQRFCRNRSSDFLLAEDGTPINLADCSDGREEIREHMPLCTTHHPVQLEKRRQETKILMAKSEEARQDQTDQVEKTEASEGKAKWNKNTRVSSSQNRMINPMRSYYQPPNWNEVYTDPTRPLYLDVGCAKGKFMEQLAKLNPTEYNYLGVEIREALVNDANERWQREHPDLKNLWFVWCNINVCFSVLLESLPSNVLKCVSFQFPDPWARRKHQKRRVIQPSLVADVAKFLPKDGEVYLSSDREEIALEMYHRFRDNENFEPFYVEEPGEDKICWLEKNPFGIPTERELVCEVKGRKVYRTKLRRK